MIRRGILLLFAGYLLVLPAPGKLAVHSVDDEPPSLAGQEEDGAEDPLPVGAVRRFGSSRVWGGDVTALAFSPDGRTLVSGGDDQTIHYWDTDTGKPLGKKRMPGVIRALGFSPDGKRLVAAGGIKPEHDGDGSNDVRFGSVIEGVYFWRVAIDHVGTHMPLAFSRDGKKLLVGKSLKLWNIETGKATDVTGDLYRNLGDRVSCLSLSPDGKRLAVTCYGSRTFVVDLDSGKLLGIPAKLPNCPFVEFTPDGKTVATAGGDSIRFWDPATGKDQQPFGETHAARVAFSTKGSLVAWTDDFATDIQMGDLVSGNRASPLRGHRAAIRSLAFSPDGKQLASASRDGTVLLWDLTKVTFFSPKQAQRERHLARDHREAVPEGVRVSMLLDKQAYLLGEPVVASFCVENVGKGLFHINLGGDYRFAYRSLRFHVTATDSRGIKVADPEPSGYCMGGISYSPEVLPGKKHVKELDLVRYCRFEEPGTYQVTIAHDLGWQATKECPLPVARGTLTLVRPSAEQACQRVKELERGAKNEYEYSVLRDPMYLASLVEYADSGSERALTGIGSIATPEATGALLRLAQTGKGDFALQAARVLNHRLPDPQLEGKLIARNPFDNDHEEVRRWLVARSWKPKFAAGARRIARELLRKDDIDRLRCGAFILEAVGEKEDLRPLIEALDRAIAQTANTPLEDNTYPRPRGACQELLRAAHMLNSRNAPVPFRVRSPGEAVVFLDALKSRDSFRPRDWEKTVSELLQHEIPYVREMALVNMPLPVPNSLARRIPPLLLDSNVNVQIAACKLVEESKDPLCKEPLLRLMAGARDEWLLRGANNAAWALGLRYEAIELLVSRLDEKKIAQECLHMLSSYILKDGGSCAFGGVENTAALKARWQNFLRLHGDRLRQGHTFKVDDPALPPDLFPGYTFYPPHDLKGKK